MRRIVCGIQRSLAGELLLSCASLSQTLHTYKKSALELTAQL